jgi:hypothetical protein
LPPLIQSCFVRAPAKVITGIVVENIRTIAKEIYASFIRSPGLMKSISKSMRYRKHIILSKQQTVFLSAKHY